MYVFMNVMEFLAKASPQFLYMKIMILILFLVDSQ